MNMIMKRKENDMAKAMNEGAAEGGAVRMLLAAAAGSTDVSYIGEMDVVVQLTGSALLEREQDPKTPMKTLGPSPADASGFVRAVDGVTVSSATWSWSMTEGDKSAKSDNKKAVNMTRGDK